MRSSSTSHLLAVLLAAVLLGVLLAGVISIIISPPRGKPVELLPPPTPGDIRVHVAGSVGRPGVYALAPGSIVLDAITAAGGLLPEADMQSINLASKLEDGQRLRIPFTGEAEAAAASDGERIHINTASAPQLERLPGIGPVLAQSIVQHRERYGPFQRPEDLLEVEGIGPAKLDSIIDLITVP